MDASVETPLRGRIQREESPCNNETILLVEDESEVRKLAAEFLRAYGYTILEAQHGVDALSICIKHQGPIDLMLTDMVMPEMNGHELAQKHLKPMKPRMKVLYMSGYTDDAFVRNGVLEKGVNFVQKPFSLVNLAKQIREILDKDKILSI